MLKESEEIIVEDVYYLINNSSNSIITEKQAKQYIKDDVYHTIGRSQYWDTYIFDMEKNSILPEVRYLDWFSWWKNLNSLSWMFWPWLFFILALWWIFVYYNFFAPEDKPDLIKQSTQKEESVKKPKGVIDYIPSVWDKNIIINDKKKVDKVNLNPVVNNSDKDHIQDLDLQLTNAENSKIFLWTKIDILELQNETLQTQYNMCLQKNELTELNNTEFFDENLVLQEKLREQSELNLESNQLFLSLWQDIFNLCEKTDNNYCKDYLYRFYNLRN